MRRYIGQQPGTKSGRRPGDKPRIIRGSTARLVPPSVYMGFPLFNASEETFGTIVFDVLG